MKRLGETLVTIVLVVSLCDANGQSVPVPESSGATGTQQNQALQNQAELRKMIGRGQAVDALRQLDVMAAQKPIPAGVDTLRGVALYSQGRFQEADAAFASALNQNPRDEEATQMRGLTLYR